MIEDMTMNHSFWVFYAGLALGGLVIAAWACWNWYMVSRRCMALTEALERERARRRPGKEKAQ